MQSVFRKYSDLVYFVILLFTVAVSVWGNFLITISCIVLSVFWVLSGDFSSKMKVLLTRKSSVCYLIICFLFLLRFAVDLPSSEAIRFVIKYLPMLIFVVGIGSYKELSPLKFHAIVLTYVFTIDINTLFCFCNYLYTSTEVQNFREISCFISYIRLALFSLLGVVICGHYLFFNSGVSISRNERVFLWFSAIWLVLFVLILKTITGYIVLGVLVLSAVIAQVIRVKNVTWKYLDFFLLVIGWLIISSFVYSEARYFLHVDPLHEDDLEETTVAGNSYHHVFDKKVENGHYVNIYVCEPEIAEAWEQRMGCSVYSKNEQGYEYIYALVRYMASKNLRKDAEGMAQLTDRELKAVKNGFTNYRFTSNYDPRKRIYEAFWEIYHYYYGGNPNGHSITQRVEFLKCAANTMEDHLWFGTGALVKTKMSEEYRIAMNHLDEVHWNLPHNQFMLTAVTCGLTGLIIFILCFLGIFIFSSDKWNALTIGWYVTFFISCFSEDTLNTSAGQAFGVLFAALILFAQPKRTPILQ